MQDSAKLVLPVARLCDCVSAYYTTFVATVPFTDRFNNGSASHVNTRI